MSDSIKFKIGDKELEFGHTAVNMDAHLFINGMHDPKLCPECIKPKTLVFKKSATKGAEGSPLPNPSVLIDEQIDKILSQFDFEMANNRELYNSGENSLNTLTIDNKTSTETAKSSIKALIETRDKNRLEQVKKYTIRAWVGADNDTQDKVEVVQLKMIEAVLGSHEGLPSSKTSKHKEEE